MAGTKKMSQKMKNFCYAYMRTGNATQAYLEAYDTTNQTTAVQEGCKLLMRDDITEFLKGLNQPIVNKITNEREKKRQIIWKRIDRSIEKEDETAIARYMDILNKMDAEYVNINRNIDDSSEKLAGLDTDQLRALLDKDNK
jgi:phage terminase small subunit